MSAVEVFLPDLPECWETCGSCQSGEIRVVEILTAPGSQLDRNDPVLVLETDKTTLEIPAGHDGRLVELAVAIGDCVGEGMRLFVIERDTD